MAQATLFKPPLAEAVRVTFVDEKDDLDPRDLSEYLYLVEACAIAAKNHGIEWSQDEDYDEKEKNEIIESFAKISPIEWAEIFNNKDESVVAIGSMRRNSPLEITLIGAVVILGSALILSGGKFELTLKGLKVELPPIGVGILKLKEALGFGQQVVTGYSVQSVTVKLENEEVDLMMLVDPSHRNRGGFQNFIIGLQGRLNKTTKEIVLYEDDLKRIGKCIENPSKGGFQGRIAKIFGQHFQS